MHEPHDTPARMPTPIPAAVTRPLASGAAAPARVELPRGARPASRSLLAGLPAPVAAWVRRARWLALVTLLVLLPVAQCGASKGDLFAAATAARAAWRYDLALADYARIAQSDPADPRPHCLQGEVLTLQQLYTQAQAAYAACERLGGGTASAWLGQGDAADAGGDFAAAEHAWLRAAALGSPSAHRRLALLYEQEGRLTEAATQWQALGASDPQAQEHLGLLALSAGNYDAARAAFVAARTLPGYSGQEALDGGFVTLAGLGQQDAAGLVAVGTAFVQAGMLPLALRPLERAIALDPTYGPAHGYLAWVLLAGGQSAAAAESATAVRLAPFDSFAWFVASQLAVTNGRWTDAVTDLQHGINVDGSNPVLWEAVGRAYEGEHDYLHAELSLVNAAKLGDEPEFTEALLQYYLTHGIGAALGNGTNAAATALNRFPTNAQIAVLAGAVYDMATSVDLAYVAYQRANTLDPSLPEPYFYLGRVALNGGNEAQGVLDLDTYLALRPSGDLAASARTLLQPYQWYSLQQG